MKHTLSAENADELNVGKGVNPGESVEDTPGFLKEGDTVEGLPLPNGNVLVLTGVVDGLVTGVVFAPDEGSENVPDEVPSDLE